MKFSNKIIVATLTLLLVCFGGLSAQVQRIGGIDLMGQGIWNWDQKLDQVFQNQVINGDMTCWAYGTTDTIPYGWSTTYAEINQVVSRESDNYKFGSYSMRLTSNGTNGCTDYRLTIRNEWKNRYFSLGFWYYCPIKNDKIQKVIFFDGFWNNSIYLKKDGKWHWAKITKWVDNEAIVLGMRVICNDDGAADTDDYVLIDGVTIMQGRVVTDWSYSYWDALYNMGIRYTGNYGIGGDPFTYYKLSIYGLTYLSAAAPVLTFRESDKTYPEGLYRIVLDGSQFRIDRNRTSLGNFSSYSDDFVLDSTHTALRGFLSLKYVTAPSGASGWGQVYANSSDGLLHYKDAAGTDYDLTSGTGGGGDYADSLTVAGVHRKGDLLFNSQLDAKKASDSDSLGTHPASYYQVSDATLTDIADGTIAENLVNIANPWTVNEGGTGASTLTDGGILLGSGSGAITALGVATNGQIPIGDGTTDPVLATITGTANEVTVANAAGTITLSLPTGINAAKIADGSVSSAEFQYLGSVSSDIQTQLNAKQANTFKEPIQITIVNPDSIPDVKICIFKNYYGSSATIDSIKLSTDKRTTSYVVTLQETPQNDTTTAAVIDVVTADGSGTGVYYKTETSISGPTIENTHWIWLKPSKTIDISSMQLMVFYHY